MVIAKQSGGATGGSGGPQLVNLLVLNIRSLRMNLDFLLMNELVPKMDILVLTETWVYSHEEGSMGISGYRAFFCSNDVYRSGGVVVYVRESFSVAGVAFSAGNADCAVVDI